MLNRPSFRVKFLYYYPNSTQSHLLIYHHYLPNALKHIKHVSSFALPPHQTSGCPNVTFLTSLFARQESRDIHRNIHIYIYTSIGAIFDAAELRFVSLYITRPIRIYISFKNQIFARCPAHLSSSFGVRYFLRPLSRAHESPHISRAQPYHIAAHNCT